MNDFPVATHTTNSKRHSFSPGPRPLRLALSSTSTPVSPGTTFSPFTPYSTFSPRSESPSSSGAPSGVTRVVRNLGTLRRQSSISYYTPKDSEARNSTVRAPARNGLTRSASVGAKASFSPDVGTGNGNRRSAGYVESNQSEKVTTPHTLAEKHADLLQFIAQKESKCLELRSQLAVHEAELLQLKRKWERIVNRGFERSNGINDYTPSNSTSTASATAQLQGGAVLEGIREGVQGVSRFIAAGLGEIAPAPPPPSPPLASGSRQKAARRRHSSQPSSSSVSTYATNASNSTRLSQSSASSLGDESTLQEEGEGGRKEGEGDGEVLRATDTAPKPTTGAHPAFERNHNRRPSDSSFHVGSKDRASLSSIAGERTTNIHRRKSRDRASPPPSSVLTSDSLDLSTTTSPTADCARMKHTLKAKRASMNRLPPVAPIPGLRSLTAISSSGGQPVASWVDNVGKKWEEIQRGPAFTKGQKRASLLFSDVSQTIASALSSPPLASASYNTLVPRPPPPSSPSSSTSASGSVTPLQSSSSVSLLDEDDTEAAARGGLVDVMMPIQVSVQPLPHGNASLGVKEAEGAGAAQALDDDEEWGW